MGSAVSNCSPSSVWDCALEVRPGDLAAQAREGVCGYSSSGPGSALPPLHLFPEAGAGGPLVGRSAWGQGGSTQVPGSLDWVPGDHLGAWPGLSTIPW